MRSASPIGGSVGSGAAGAALRRARPADACSAARPRRPPARPAPGTAASAARAAAPAPPPRRPPSPAASDCRQAGAISAASAVPSMPPLVTTMPAAVETSSAGICDTSPSPTVSVVNVAAASANGMPCRTMPIARPPRMLIDGDDQPGDRVAAHELRGAVHRAVEAALLLQLLAAPARRLLVDQPGGQVGVDRHLLARHRIQAEPRGDLGDAAGAFGDDHEVHHQQDREHDQPDHHVAAHQEAAERGDHVAGRQRPLVAVRQDQPRGRDVERQAQQRGQQQQGRERGEVERALQEQRHHQHQHRGGDRQRQAEIQQHRRQRQDQHRQQRHHAERQADIAAGRVAAQPGEDRGHASGKEASKAEGAAPWTPAKGRALGTRPLVPCVRGWRGWASGGGAAWAVGGTRRESAWSLRRPRRATAARPAAPPTCTEPERRGRGLFPGGVQGQRPWPCLLPPSRRHAGRRRRHRRRPAPHSRAACCAARGWRCRGWLRHGCGCRACGRAFR